ncbi:hypothetical protein [Shouchella patagoniensis]|uniref:DUF1281 family ferredoxin-like fold protein n=1 Tax=Shouchella patagoniensis TaxID=228576 RepID=UPI000994C951|nr:hypothetical protein [Shouchella patagoniensis]
MPNHISNKLKVIGLEKEVQAVMDFIKIDEKGIGTIDFSKITPIPKWIYGVSPDVKGISLEDEEKWGSENTILNWQRKHWGTKWNAYSQPDVRSSDDTVFFQTAWNGVEKLIQKIAWIFPNVVIEYSYADEDLGSSNNGIYTFKENEILKEIEYEFDSKEAYELAFELCENGKIPPHYKFNDALGTYEFVED